jgi:abortive infection bacteriophage resistance protein
MNQNLKFATNIEEQITKLVERGMVIEDIEKAKENLLDIGYFRLGFYWFPFEKSYPRKQKRDIYLKMERRLTMQFSCIILILICVILFSVT